MTTDLITTDISAVSAVITLLIVVLRLALSYDGDVGHVLVSYSVRVGGEED